MTIFFHKTRGVRLFLGVTGVKLEVKIDDYNKNYLLFLVYLKQIAVIKL